LKYNSILKFYQKQFFVKTKNTIIPVKAIKTLICSFHAFDISRNEQCNDPKDKENIRISIRKSNAYSDDKLNNILQQEAMKNGFDIKKIEEKPIKQKKM